MKILSAHLENFASYKELDFDFTGQGLTLVQGATGAGKSTLCDAISWCLFGITAKGGKVDEIKSWGTDEVVKGCITLALNNGKMFQVCRSRGVSKDNDLLLWENGGAYRGKDLQDTQKIITAKLGMDADLYLASSYYHEFSQTAQFFMTTARNRRVICEQLVDLSLATKLKEVSSEQLSTKSKELTNINQKLNITKSNLEQLRRNQEQENTRYDTWERTHERALEQTVAAYEKFESRRHRIINDICNTCGTKLAEPKEVHDTSENPYASRLVELETEKNPHTEAAKDYTADIEVKREEIGRLSQECQLLETDIYELEQLQLVIQDYRSESIKNTIRDIQESTNKYLTQFFDGEIRVQFDVASADKLEVSITKDGNQASFTQLSKGQRCMLKLCFGVAVMMAVQNHHGLSFNVAMFDEALDGLSDTLKLKAVNMLQTLTPMYETILLVEHSESVKAMVDNKYNVELINGASQIEKI